MNYLNYKVKDFLRVHLVFVATVDSAGDPHVVPKGTVDVLGDRHIIFVDLQESQTKKNLLHNPSVAITVVNPTSYEGYQLKGRAEIIERGDAYDKLMGEAPALLNYPRALYAIKVEINKITDIDGRDINDDK